MATRSAWYLTKYDVTEGPIGPIRTPAIHRYFPFERPDVVWSEIETLNGGCLVKVWADDANHAVLLADPDFTEIPQ
jgi:hypothetical protein